MDVPQGHAGVQGTVMKVWLDVCGPAALVMPDRRDTYLAAPGGASRKMSASHASAVGEPRPGLMSKRSGVSESMRQPEPNAARSSPSVTRRGPSRRADGR